MTARTSGGIRELEESPEAAGGIPEGGGGIPGGGRGIPGGGGGKKDMIVVDDNDRQTDSSVGSNDALAGSPLATAIQAASETRHGP